MRKKVPKTIPPNNPQNNQKQSKPAKKQSKSSKNNQKTIKNNQNQQKGLVAVFSGGARGGPTRRLPWAQAPRARPKTLPPTNF